MPKPQRIIKGNIYGQWTVISNELKRHKDRAIYYNVRCNCGHEGWRAAALLECGRTKACKSCCKTVNNFNTFLERYMKGVKERAKVSNFHLDFDIDYLNSIWEKQDGKCALSGLPISLRANWQKTEQTASLDRIDNKKGYVKGNVQWVHKDVNFMKHKFDQDYFIQMCKLIVNQAGIS